MIAIPKGTKITCPECGDHIATIRQDVEYGERIEEGLFEWANQKFGFGERTSCKKCGYYWAMSSYHFGRIHTDEGWKP